MQPTQEQEANQNNRLQLTRKLGEQCVCLIGHTDGECIIGDVQIITARKKAAFLHYYSLANLQRIINIITQRRDGWGKTQGTVYNVD